MDCAKTEVTMTYNNMLSNVANLKKIEKAKEKLNAKVTYSVCKNRIALETALEPYHQKCVEIAKAITPEGEEKIDPQKQPELYKQLLSEVTAESMKEATVTIRLVPFELIENAVLPAEYLSSMYFMILE